MRCLYAPLRKVVDTFVQPIAIDENSPIVDWT